MQGGDIGYIPPSYGEWMRFQLLCIPHLWISEGHYVENTGNTTLHYLEILKTDKYQDVSLNQVSDTRASEYPSPEVVQWLALTPPALVKAHLDVSDETISHFSKTKPIIVGK